MERENIVKELIEKVSILYRGQRDKVNQIKTEIFKIEDKLQDKDMPYNDYMKLQNDLAYLKNKYKKESDIADGISLAREELFE